MVRILVFSCAITIASCSGIARADAKLLIVGASGGTGSRALQGILDVGYKPQQLRVLTRDPSKPALVPLRELGVELCVGDLEKPASLAGISSACTGCYIHSTAGDTKRLDTGEVTRASNLAAALVADGAVSAVAFNSAAAEPGHGVVRIEQKHAVEDILSAEYGLPATHLRANLFMEELWKGYTRPKILRGAYPFSLPPTRGVHLTSVRDMGRFAGVCLAHSPPPPSGVFC